MVKVVGTGKVDANGKMPLPDAAAKAIGLKKGDSVIFSKEPNGTEVIMSRAEGARMVSGKAFVADDRAALFKKLRLFMALCAFASVLLLVVLLVGRDSVESVYLLAVVMLMVAAVATMGAAFACEEKMVRIPNTGCPVTFSYGTVMGNFLGRRPGEHGRPLLIFVDDMMSFAPDRVTYRLGDNGEEVECPRSKHADGYSVYTADIKPTAAGDTVPVRVTAVYRYKGGKSIEVRADFEMKVENDMSFSIEEKGYGAEVSFDNNTKKADFDDTLFDPTSGGSAL
jgi:bifunctional DNA-binding transcriptional regulator/antitoxin component of YhaV-PrlF toxin-antitoxin module